MTTLAPTIYTRTFPRTVGWLRDLILILLGALFIAALAQVEIPLPFTPVPITGQTFGVLLIGAALGSKRGAASLDLLSCVRRIGSAILRRWRTRTKYPYRRDRRVI